METLRSLREESEFAGLENFKSWLAQKLSDGSLVNEWDEEQVGIGSGEGDNIQEDEFEEILSFADNLASQVFSL